MKTAEFVHLHTHSQYSLLDGACRLDGVIALAKEHHMPALAITDHGNMFGAVEFYQKAISAGIKPIIGIEAYVSGGPMTERQPNKNYPASGFHMALLARNREGYQNLIKITTAGYLEGFYHRPRVDREFLAAHSEGIIATSACPQGEVNWNLRRDRYEIAKEAALFYHKLYGEGNYYLEIQNHGLDFESDLLPKIIELAKDTGIPLVCSNDCHYLRKEDSEAHDALLCIQTGKFVSDTDRMKFDNDEFYFKSPDEMREIFKEYPEALANTLHIAEKCNVELELGKLHLPHFPIPREFVDADEYLRKISEDGLNTRYDEITDEITTRLDYELGVIKKLGYAGYFLIVKDFIDYARSIDVPVGPGRGSAAGSIVSYSIGITNLDPIHYELLFERFLNPERMSMPDIDIDFADRGRDKIIEYVIKKYGKDNVAQIITFGTMAARGVIRDVGRVLSIPYSEVDRIAKMIPFAVDMTLKRALKENPDIQKLADADERVAKLLDYAKRLEGLTRHASTHAAGVVIAPSALTDFVPLFSGSNGEITTQFDMKRVESIGLLKMDFLGLRTLTVIDDAVKMIARKTGEKFDIDSIPLDDSAVYQMFSRGETIGVFQFESPGMRDYLRKLNPESLEDLIAMNALYRPGPLDSGMINVYIDCKRKAKDVSYAHPLLEEILKSTYGVIVFQEQVLRIANSLAGYSMGSADILRKAMGKKDSKLMAEQEKGFIEGCLNNKIDKKTATTVFDQIETFARYGFNRAHSACYGYLAYQTAYLKVHHPLEFFAATMTSEIDSTDRIYILMEELRRSKIEILPPDVNKSNLEFAVSDGKIRFGMLAIKNVGEGCVKAILSARETDGEFKSMGDFVSRVNIKSVNRRALESLVLSGALDSLTGTRAQKQGTVEKALEFGSRIQQKSQSHDLFAGENGLSDRTDLKLANAEPFTATRTLSLEKDALGFYLSGHPLDQYRREIKSFGATPASDLSELRDGSETRIAGSITAVKLLNDKRGNRMAFVTAEDFSGSVELICFSDCYEKASGLITEGSLIMAIGRLSTREGESPKVLVNEVVALSRLAERFECSLILKLTQDITDERVDRALSFLGRQKGTTPVYLSYGTEESQALIRCGKFRVNPKEEALRELRHILGENEVFLAPRLN